MDGRAGFQHLSDRVRALLLFMRWAGLAIIDTVSFREASRPARRRYGTWMVKLHRTKTGEWVQVAIPREVAEAVLGVPSMSDTYFFWTGHGQPQTACKGWRRCIGKVFKAARLKRNGKLLRCHLHMLRDTFAVEKLEAGATMEEISKLLGHRRTQERLKRASMLDWAPDHERKTLASEKGEGCDNGQDCDCGPLGCC